MEDPNIFFMVYNTIGFIGGADILLSVDFIFVTRDHFLYYLQSPERMNP